MMQSAPGSGNSEPFALGVNYWPRRKAMYFWSDFDRNEVREEFRVISDLGLGWVRLFLLWDDFQPAPDVVSERSVDALHAVCDAAVEAGLRLNVTFFTGHMSGPNWAPGWLLEGEPLPGARALLSGGKLVESGYRNPFVDPAALDAEELLLETVVRRLAGHRGVGVWNLGNEPDLFAEPPSSELGRVWVKRMRDVIRRADAKTPVTLGLHMDSLKRNNGFRVDQVFAETDLAVMHAYSMYTSWARDPLDAEVVAYACAVTQELSGRSVLMEEVGGCTVPGGGPATTWNWEAYGKSRSQFMASERGFADHVERLLTRLWEQGAAGVYLWCFADYAEKLWDRPPCSDAIHERHFGLVRPDGTFKPHAKVVERFAAEGRRVRPRPSDFRLGLGADEFYANPDAELEAGFLRYLASAR
jgi:endo-1,4-beta-mannosidase